jgi:hypothetical protein
VIETKLLLELLMSLLAEAARLDGRGQRFSVVSAGGFER